MTSTILPDLAHTALLSGLRAIVHPLNGAADDYDPLIAQIGKARFVLIGEASHGTHEFYRELAQITKRLIRQQGFNAVAVEADWPDAYRVNRYVRGRGTDAEAIDALAGFQRFPTWMWRNADVLDFIGWLRDYNDSLAQNRPQVGFYGLDLYSLHASMAAVIAYLEKIDPEAAHRARERYACFDLYGDDPQAYGFAAGLELGHTCENEVITQLIDIRRHAAEYAMRDGQIAEEDFFYTEQNARLVRDAEHYYRTMYRGEVSSWNLRDRHMAETLESLVEFLRGTARSQRSLSGRTIRISATHAPRRWGCAASGTLANWSGNGMPIAQSWSGSRPTVARSRLPQTGMHRPSARLCGRRLPAATRRSSTTSARNDSC